MLMRAEAAALRHRTTDFAPLARLGAVALGGFAATVGIWALFVPIEGAVIAPGIIVNDGRIQVLRHEGGGVLQDIKVREGDAVKAGQVIAVLAPQTIEAQRDQLAARLAGLDVRLARLVAERDGTVFSYDAAGNTLVQQIVADQQQEFDTRAARRLTDDGVLNAQLAALESQKSGLAAGNEAYEMQIASVAEDLRLRRDATVKGYGRAAQMRELEREQARLQAALAGSQSSLAALDEQIAEAQSRLAKAQADSSEEIAKALADARAERSEVVEQQRAAQTALDRVEVRAPGNGVVAKLYVNTPGSAIEPYSPLAEIVPEDVPLIVEAMVDPMDVDEVKLGQQAEVVFSGFDRNLVDPVMGDVEFISPSSRVEERTGQQFYTVRLKVEREGLPPIMPGMPAQTYFETGRHTFVQYLFAPIADSFTKAFR
ncbi:MAG: HlyD family type I secretion periplasmic adaptor subunit [Devosia sp.]